MKEGSFNVYTWLCFCLIFWSMQSACSVTRQGTFGSEASRTAFLKIVLSPDMDETAVFALLAETSLQPMLIDRTYSANGQLQLLVIQIKLENESDWNLVEKRLVSTIGICSLQVEKVKTE